MTKGDIILTQFPFTDLSGSKLRPAVVLFANKLDVTVSFISTQIKWLENTDVELTPSFDNGLKSNSIIRTNKIATIDKNLAKGLLGKLTLTELVELNVKMKILLGIV